MRKEIFEKISQDYRKYYLSEFSFDDEQRNITFNIVCIDSVKNEITVAISSEGKISICSFELKLDEQHCLFFEYGLFQNKISVEDFELFEEAGL